MRFPIPVPDASLNSIWLTAFSGDSVTITGKYLTVHVENPFTDNEVSLQSVVDIDNVCLRRFNFVSSKDVQFGHTALRLYPNPNTGLFTLELPAPATAQTRLRLTDLAGRLVLEQTAEQGTTQQQVNASALSAGMYFVQVLEAGKVMGTGRFVKE